jgi:hypothetical protein
MFYSFVDFASMNSKSVSIIVLPTLNPSLLQDKVSAQNKVEDQVRPRLEKITISQDSNGSVVQPHLKMTL